jgi:hypothetical protein
MAEFVAAKHPEGGAHPTIVVLLLACYTLAHSGGGTRGLS